MTQNNCIYCFGPFPARSTNHQPYPQPEYLDEESNSTVDTNISINSSPGSEELVTDEIRSFQRIVYDAEIGKTILTRRKLVDLLSFKKLESDLNSETESNDGDDVSEDAEMDSEIGDYQIQILRTLLKGAGKNVFTLTRNMFLSIIEDFKS
jgi:hypothetical protein